MAINYSIKPIIRTDKPIKQNSKYPIYWLVRLNNKQVKIPAKKDVDKKDISDKEIELYCQESQFKNYSEQSKQSQSINSMSIDQLTANFVSNLESENPGTANVVIRTSSKVTTKNQR